MQSIPTARERLSAKRLGSYVPAQLAEQIFDLLQHMEDASDGPMSGYRSRTGLYNAAAFRGHSNLGATEDAIIMWLSELMPNSEPQVRDLVPGLRPDIVLSFDRDSRDEDILVILEAKPVWKRWISSGNDAYSGVTSDEHGRCTGSYVSKNINQVREDRDKLLANYTHLRDRLMLLALVFQRRGEVDQRLIEAVGTGWDMTSRHIVDQCSSLDDNIGLTAMVFWPKLTD